MVTTKKLIWSGIIPGKQVTTNKAYPTSKQGFRYLSKEGKDYKKLVADLCGYTYSGEVLEDDLEVEIKYTFADFRKRDVNNFDKGLIDAMQGILFKDDCQIQKITLEKETIKGVEPKTSVKVYATKKQG